MDRTIVMHQFDDGHLHVRGRVPGQVEVLPGGVAGVVVADRVQVLAQCGSSTCMNCVDHIFRHTIHFSIDFNSFPSRLGLHCLAHLYVVAHLAQPGAPGHAAPVPLGSVGGPGGPGQQLRPRQLVAERAPFFRTFGMLILHFTTFLSFCL